MVFGKLSSLLQRPPLIDSSFRPKVYLILCCSLLLAWGTWQIWENYRETQQERAVTTAEILFQKRDWRGASISARRALYLHKNPALNIEASNVMARICREIQVPQEIYWRSELVRLQPGDFKSKEELVQTAIRYDSLPLAQSTLESIPSDQRTTAAFHRLMATYAIASGQPAYAEAALREALKLEPSSAETRLNLAKVLLAYGPPAAISDAQALLDSFPDTSENQVEILRTRLEALKLSGKLAEALTESNRLLALKEANFIDKLDNLELLFKINSPIFKETLAKLESESSEYPERVYRLASWLRTSGWAGDALAWLNTFPKSVQTSSPLNILRAECAVSAREWAQLENFLKDQDWGETESLRLAFLSRAGREMGTSKTETASLIQKSLSLAKANPALSLTLGDLFASWSWPDESLEAWWQASRSPQAKLALAKLFTFYKNEKNLNGIWRVSKAASELDSSDLAAKNNFAMTSLILGNGTESASVLARDLYLRYPSVPAFASTYAFSLFLKNKAGDALTVLQKLPPSTLQNPEIAPYYVLALARTKHFTEAAQYRRYVQPSILFPEELVFYQKADRTE